MKDTTHEEEAFDVSVDLNVVTQSVIEPELLKTLLKERGLSATALNNYLHDPWDYFYRNVLRIPEIQPLPMLFGTVLHNTLEHITREHTNSAEKVTPTKIKVLLERELGRLPISEEEFASLHERGYEALLQYTEHVYKSLPKTTKEEFSLRVVLETGNKAFPEVILTGKLDRLDFDEEGRVQRVVDYKSGKPKTKGQIEGTTKDSNGDYKRQLTFYALLLSLYDDERYRCREGVLSFVEPHANGDIKEFSYSITDEEIEELKREVIRVALDITNGAFLNAPPREDSNYRELILSLQNRD